MLEDNQKKRNTLLVVIGSLVITALLFLGMVMAVKRLNGKKAISDMDIRDTVSRDITRNEAPWEKLQTAEFNDAYLVDYMILASMYSACDGMDPMLEREGPGSPPEIIQGFELCDIDADGKQELLLESLETNNGMARPTLTAFDSTQSIFSVWTDESAAGGISFQIMNDNNKVNICKFYSTIDYIYGLYCEWSEEGWSENSVLEKEGDTIIQCRWDGQDVSEEVWLEQEEMLGDMEITNSLQDYVKLNSEATAMVTAEAIYSYYKNELGLNAFLLQPDETGSVYYVILDSYMHNRWNNQMNSDKANGREMFTYRADRDTSDIMLVIQADGRESEVSCMVFPNQYDILQASYDDGIIIEYAHNSYVYEINDNHELEYIRKLFMTDIENKLISAKWYTLSTTGKRVIYEYEFLENETILYKEYHDINGSWELSEDAVSRYFYTYDSDSKSLFVNYGQDGKPYQFDDTYQVFIETPSERSVLDYLGSYDQNGYYSIYQKCLVQYEEFPDYDALFSACDVVMKSYYAVTEEESTEVSAIPSSNNTESVILTKEQAYNGVVNYCYSKNPDLSSIIDEGYNCYWLVGELEGNEYIVTYRSYTGAIIYYHVNANSGTVYSMEYVPGITDGEVQGNDSFSVYDYL